MPVEPSVARPSDAAHASQRLAGAYFVSENRAPRPAAGLAVFPAFAPLQLLAFRLSLIPYIAGR